MDDFTGIAVNRTDPPELIAAKALKNMTEPLVSTEMNARLALAYLDRMEIASARLYLVATLALLISIAESEALVEDWRSIRG